MFKIHTDRRDLLLFAGILLLGLFLRIGSLGWNSFPHGDVVTDVKAGVSLMTQGNFTVGPYAKSPDATFLFDIARTNGNEVLTQHPPLLMLLGAGVASILQIESTEQGIFLSYRLLTLFLGMGVLVIIYGIARSILGQKVALWVALWSACSYLLMDFSGNGSLYMLQTFAYLLWVHVALGRHRLRHVLLGCMTGIAYMVSFQSIILVPAGLLVIAFHNDHSIQKRCYDVLIFLCAASPIVLPWLLRNYFLFGDPLFSHYVNQTYIYNKADMPFTVVDGIVHYTMSFADRLALLRSITLHWLPNNLYYIVRKLFILVPLAFLFFCYAFIDYLYDHRRLVRVLPIVVVLLLHCGISAAWPVTKFRYLVPILPFVFIIAAEHMNAVCRTYRTAVFGLTTLLIVWLSLLTYKQIPTHTYYYNGAITEDAFSGSEELDYIRTYTIE